MGGRCVVENCSAQFNFVHHNGQFIENVCRFERTDTGEILKFTHCEIINHEDVQARFYAFCIAMHKHGFVTPITTSDLMGLDIHIKK